MEFKKLGLKKIYFKEPKSITLPSVKPVEVKQSQETKFTAVKRKLSKERNLNKKFNF